MKNANRNAERQKRVWLYTTARLWLALKLVEIKRNVWCVYKNGKVVIITTHKRIAERYANEHGKLRSKSERDNRP